MTQVVPRWYRLVYHPASRSPSPGILNWLAKIWGAVGNLGVNPLLVGLVKTKQTLQQGLRVTGWFRPLAGLGVGATIFGLRISRSQGHAILRTLLAALGAALVVYVLTWIRGRAVQKREDRMRRPDGTPRRDQ